MRDDVFAGNLDRLIEAADAVCEALAQVADAETGRCPYPPDLARSPESPACLDAFSLEEVTEASAFLCRLGLLAPISTPDRG
jgi:hypothetical protein